tara:strand:+ start:541 stop:1293 length:753 start_codon:yes stop_codon:yes gene_type:complete
MSDLVFAHDNDVSGEICIKSKFLGKEPILCRSQYDSERCETYWNQRIVLEKWQLNPTMPYPQWLFYGSKIPKPICDDIIKEALLIPAEDATTFRTGAGGFVDKKTRLTRIRWMKPAHIMDSPVLRDLVRFIFQSAREVNAGFRVNYDSLPSIQVTEYLEPGYHYDWHHDIDWSRQDGKQRKLSFVIQMTDPEEYKGGNLEFRYIQNPQQDQLRGKGTIILFMPYHEHRVTPIVSGSRISLVGWFEGEPWK